MSHIRASLPLPLIVPSFKDFQQKIHAERYPTDPFVREQRQRQFLNEERQRKLSKEGW